MTELNLSKNLGEGPLTTSIKHNIRPLDDSEEDLERVWQLWQIIFPAWPIARARFMKIRELPGTHYIHDQGFCLSYLSEGAHGKIAAIGVLPEFQGKGLGTAVLEVAQAGLRKRARDNGEGELKTLEIGSWLPRFWLKMPVDFPQRVKDFFVHRGMPQSESDIIYSKFQSQGRC